MRQGINFLLILFLPAFVNAQQSIDSLRNVYLNATGDAARYATAKYIYDHYEESNKDSALYYAQQSLQLARRNNEILAQAYYMNNTAYQLIGMGKDAEALQYILKAFNIVEDPKNERPLTWITFSIPFNGSNRLLLLAYTHHMFAILMRETQNTEQEIFHYKEARRIASEIGHPVRQMLASMNLGRSYMTINKLDSAMIYEKEAEQLNLKSSFRKYLGQVYLTLGNIYFEMHNLPQTLENYYKSMQVAKEENNLNGLNNTYFFLTKYFLATGEKDSALYYSMMNLQTIQQLKVVRWFRVNLGTVYENVYLSYKMSNQTDSLLKYQGLTLVVKDSLYKVRIKNLSDFQAATLNEQLRLQNVEKDKINYQNKVRTYFFLGGIAVLLLLAIIFYRNNKQRQKANKVLETTLTNLKSTQQQLIESEKLAAFGSVATRMAHEIQNPLNFVNNFSELSKGLVDEIVSAKNEDKRTEATKLLTENLEKIYQHGRRASDIVKQLQEHSNKGTTHEFFENP